MPTYQFLCDKDDGGCGELIEVTCSMSEREEKAPKSCPKCKKRKAIRKIFGVDSIHIPNTLGSLVDKNSDKMSEDEKTHLAKKHTEYRKRKGPSWEATEHGMKHIGDQH